MGVHERLERLKSNGNVENKSNTSSGNSIYKRLERLKSRDIQAEVQQSTGLNIPKNFDIFNKQTPVTFNNMVEKPKIKISPTQTISTVSTGIARPTETTRPTEITRPTVTTRPTEKEILNRGDTLVSEETYNKTQPWYKRLGSWLTQVSPEKQMEMDKFLGSSTRDFLNSDEYKQQVKDTNPISAGFYKGSLAIPEALRGITNVTSGNLGGDQNIISEPDQWKVFKDARNEEMDKKTFVQNIPEKLTETMTAMLPAIALGGTPGLVELGIQAGGQNSQQALDEGATPGKAAVYGGVTGAAEALYERLFGFIPGLKGLSGNTLSKLVTGGAKQTFKRSGKDFLKKTVGEGFEEVLMEPTQAISKGLLYDDSISFDPFKKETYGDKGILPLRQMAESGAYGIMAGAIMGGINVPSQISQSREMMADLNSNIQQDLYVASHMPKTSDSYKLMSNMVENGIDTVNFSDYSNLKNTLSKEIQKMNKFEQQIPQTKPLVMSSMEAGKKFDFKDMNNKALQELRQRNGNNVQTQAPTQSPIGEKLGTQYGANEGRNVTNWDISKLERITSEPTQNSINAEQITTDNLTDAAKKYSMRTPIGGKTFTYKENTTSPHIDNRSYGNVSERKVKAYQYEHPEVKPWYQDYAKYILDNEYVRAKSGWEGDIERSMGMQGNVMKKLKDGVGSYAEIEKGLNAIIKDEGAENIAAAKRIELVIDDMLTNGFRSISGEYSDSVKPYIKLKEVLKAKRPFVSGEIGKDINVVSKNVETENETKTDKDLQYKISRKINSMAFEKAMSKMKYKTLDDKDRNKTNKKVSKPMFMNQGEEFKYWENKYVSDFSKNKNFIENIKNEHYKEIDSIEREKLLNDSYEKEDWQVPQDIIIDRGSIPKNKAIESHKKAIEKAINEGKTIPDEVIKDYPELKYNEYQKEIDNIEKPDKVDKLVDKITELVETIKGNNGIISEDNKGDEKNAEESKSKSNEQREGRSSKEIRYIENATREARGIEERARREPKTDIEKRIKRYVEQIRGARLEVFFFENNEINVYGYSQKVSPYGIYIGENTLRGQTATLFHETFHHLRHKYNENFKGNYDELYNELYKNPEYEDIIKQYIETFDEDDYRQILTGNKIKAIDEMLSDEFSNMLLEYNNFDDSKNKDTYLPINFIDRFRYVSNNLLKELGIDFQKNDFEMEDVTETETLETETPETGKPYIKTMYQGKGKPKEDVYNYVKYPIMGKGDYYAFSQKVAKNYGDEVIVEKIKLENPFVIEDDADWRKLTQAANWKYPNPYGAEAEDIIKGIDKLKSLVMQKGYDGIIVSFENNKDGDINEKTGNSVKTISNVLGHDQVVIFENGRDKNSNKGAKVNTEESQYNNNVSKEDKSTQKPNPWPKDFPPLVIMTNLKNLRLKDNGNYDLWEKAKAGDTESAFTLVNKLLKKDKIKELGVKYPNATLVSVHAEESTGRNTLPRVYATIIGELTGLKVDDGIVQSNKAFRTNKSKEERLFQKVMFDGEVKSGYTYIIVDDVMSQGGTVRGLREYIENNGGIVVAVTTLSPGYASPTQISITPETINRLKEKFGYEEINKALKEFDVANSIDELTEAEGRDILRKFRNVNEFRDRSTTQRRARGNSQSETTNKGTGTVSFTEGLTSRKGGPKIGRASGQNTTGESKKASEIFKDFSEKLGVAVRHAKVGVGRLGEFHNRTHLIKIKDANDLPVLSHEVGHYFDRLYDLSTNRSHYKELEKLGEATSRPSYSKDRVRREGVAEFVRLYLTENETAMQEAPGFYTFFEQQVPKEVIETLGDLRKEIWALVNLDPVSRVGKSISFYDDENTMDKIKKVKDVDILSGARRFYAGMVDATFPIEWAAGKIGKRAKVDISAKLAQLRGYEGIALFDLNPNLNKDFYQIDLKGSKVGDSYSIITKGIHDTKETRKDFMKYQVARRAMDYYERDLKMPDTKETYDETIRILEEKYPMFNDTFEAIVKYRYNNSKLLVDAGIYSSKQFQEMNDANKNYVPLKRIMDAFDYVAGSGGKLGSAKKLIKSLKGSGRDIMDPEESDIGNTFMYRAASMRNKILQDLTFMFDHQINIDATDGMGWLISRASAKVQPVEFNLKQVKKYLEEAGIDTTGLDLDIMARVFVPNYLAKENQIVVYRGGKPVLYDVHPELYQSIKGMKFEQLEWITKPLVAIASIQRAGIIYTEKYLMNNLFRDVGHSLISSKANIKPWDIVGGLFHTMYKTQTYKQAMRYGATTNYSAVNERSFAEETIKDIYNNAKGYRKIVSKLPPHKWIRIIRDMIEPMEMGARIAEYKKYLRQTGETEENISKAVHLSRDLSVDFKRMGSWVKALQLNRLSLFFNSQVQGVDKFVRTFKDNPGRTTIRGFIYLTLPTIILMAINHDDENYKDLPQWRKDLFWNIPLGGGLFFPIPIPYEFGVVFKVLPERLMQKYALKNEKAWRDFAETLKTTFMPELSLSALQPEIDIAMNRDWKNRPIESSSDLEVSPELRYNNYTSEFAKNIGDATGRSPKKIEYLVKGHFGTWGKTFLDATDYLSKNDNGKSVGKSYFKKFVIDAQQNSQAVDDFYENYAEVRTMNADERRLGNKPNPLQKALNSEFAGVSKDMNTIRDLQTIVDKKDIENEELIKAALQKVIIDKAKKTNKLYDVAVKVMERLK